MIGHRHEAPLIILEDVKSLFDRCVTVNVIPCVDQIFDFCGIHCHRLRLLTMLRDNPEAELLRFCDNEVTG